MQSLTAGGEDVNKRVEQAEPNAAGLIIAGQRVGALVVADCLPTRCCGLSSMKRFRLCAGSRCSG
jgi:hypothetical protein